MKRILLSGLIALTLPAHADIVIYGTRVIYPAEKKEIIVQLMNRVPRHHWYNPGLMMAILHYLRKK